MQYEYAMNIKLIHLVMIVNNMDYNGYNNDDSSHGNNIKEYKAYDNGRVI